MAYSLRSALTSLWVLILIMSFSIGAILIGVVRQGVSAHIDEAAARTRAGCAAIKDRYERYFASGTRPTASFSQEITARELTFLLEVVLAEFDGMEGGIWNPANQFIAYAFPSYQGATPKRDVPEEERPRIVELVSKVSLQGGLDAQRYVTKRSAPSPCLFIGRLKPRCRLDNDASLCGALGVKCQFTTRPGHPLPVCRHLRRLAVASTASMVESNRSIGTGDRGLSFGTIAAHSQNRRA